MMHATMSSPVDSAGVRVPPPLLYLIAVLVGYGLNRKWPLPVGERGVNLFAWAFAVAGLTLALVSIRNFRRSRTSIVPIRPATTLVISGPYRFTRNPMYVAMASMTVAVGLALNS